MKDLSHKESIKNKQKMARIIEKGLSMKSFIVGLMDKQHLRRRRHFIAKNGTSLLECDANWVVRYFASRKESSYFFIIFILKILIFLDIHLNIIYVVF